MVDLSLQREMADRYRRASSRGRCQQWILDAPFRKLMMTPPVWWPRTEANVFRVATSCVITDFCRNVRVRVSICRKEKFGTLALCSSSLLIPASSAFSTKKPTHLTRPIYRKEQNGKLSRSAALVFPTSTISPRNPIWLYVLYVSHHPNLMYYSRALLVSILAT